MTASSPSQQAQLAQPEESIDDELFGERVSE
jgi:hypothetical protein